MGWRTLSVLAATVLAATASVAPTTAAAVSQSQVGQWQVSLLPLPPDMPNAPAFVRGSDSHGGYVGTVTTAKGNEVVTWADGVVVVRGTPAGFDSVDVVGESSRDVSLLLAGGKAFTLDANGFHAVPTGAYSNVSAAAIGRRGDIAVAATNPAEPQSTVVLYRSPFGVSGLFPLQGALPNSTPVAIDDDGSVLLNDSAGPYVVHAGVMRRLTASQAMVAPEARAIRNGIVVGDAWPPKGPGPTGQLWTPDSTVGVLVVSSRLYGVNVNGLIAGARFGSVLEPEGAAAVWQGTTRLADLPLPAGAAKATARLVDDDGTVAGWASSGSVQDGGQPVVWRLVSTG